MFSFLAAIIFGHFFPASRLITGGDYVRFPALDDTAPIKRQRFIQAYIYDEGVMAYRRRARVDRISEIHITRVHTYGIGYGNQKRPK